MNPRPLKVKSRQQKISKPEIPSNMNHILHSIGKKLLSLWLQLRDLLGTREFITKKLRKMESLLPRDRRWWMNSLSPASHKEAKVILDLLMLSQMKKSKSLTHPHMPQLQKLLLKRRLKKCKRSNSRKSQRMRKRSSQWLSLPDGTLLQKTGLSYLTNSKTTKWRIK